MDIKNNINTESMTFYKIVENRMGLAEFSILEKMMAKKWIIENKKDKELTNNILHLLSCSSQAFFFNRLNVPEKIQNQGIGRELVLASINYARENNLFLINTINPYGSLDKQQLLEFYEKHGFYNLKDGFMVYHKDILSLIPEKSKQFKMT